MNYDTILELMKANRKEIGTKSAPCVRIRLKTGERFTLARIVEHSATQFVAFAYLDDETIDETPRFRFIAIAPDQICLVEAFEPNPRQPEATRRFGFAANKGLPGKAPTSSFSREQVT